jgi:hypothetical protein
MPPIVPNRFLVRVCHPCPFVKDAPRLPVQKYPRDFWEFVQRNNLEKPQPWSAYKYSTVLDIKGVRRPVPPAR